MRRTAFLVLLTLAAAACGGGTDGVGEPADDRLLPEDRLELPELDPRGFEALLEELRSTPVVVNIWGSWCGPCRTEAPDLAALARQYEGRVQFLGVDILDNRESARRFILEFDWPYPSVYDPRGAIRDHLGYLGQPVTFILDRDGDRVWEWQGAVDEELLREQIENVL
jgi:cytochrome c biogenesis protein CcmG, thiol:disulfide interchange protein DsbE